MSERDMCLLESLLQNREFRDSKM